MPLPLHQFVKNLKNGGLMCADEIAALEERLQSSGNLQDVRSLVDQLVQQERLTKFQADVLCEGKPEQLLLGNYLVLDKLGEGGMGQVYRARHRRMDRVVALKVLPANCRMTLSSLLRSTSRPQRS